MKKLTAFVFAAILITSAALSADTGVVSDSFGFRAAKVWSWINPSGDCKYRISESTGKMTLTVPTGEHDLWPKSNLNAPRFLQTVTGNFSIETKIDINPKYDCQAAGLVIWQDDTHFIRLSRIHQNASLQQVSIDVADGEKWTQVDYENNTDQSIYLRLERRGSRFNAYYSRNGDYWEVMQGFDMSLASQVQVGIFAINQWQDNPLNVSFDYFRFNAMN